MSGEELLGRYAEMLRLTQQMLEVARLAEWDRLVEIERERAVIADHLMKLEEQGGEWTHVEQVKKAHLIRSILAADDEIKSLSQAWMGELQEILGSIDTGKKLSKAYQTP